MLEENPVRLGPVERLRERVLRPLPRGRRRPLSHVVYVGSHPVDGGDAALADAVLGEEVAVGRRVQAVVVAVVWKYPLN